MKRRRRNTVEPDALDLLEEAAHLLRRLPARAGAAYLVGTVPFVLGVLFFVAWMSRGADAGRSLAAAALGLAVLHPWMKCWQAVAAEEALAVLEHREPLRPGATAWPGIAAEQLRFHTVGLAACLPALIATLPFAWVFAYFQGATVLGVSKKGMLHSACLAHARAWPRQNHFILALLGLMGPVVLLNVAAAIYAVPFLLRTLFGMGTIFATGGWNPFNTTFLAAACGVAFLVVDPFVKAVYAVRCHRCAALRTGADLLARVRTGGARAGAAVSLACALLLVAATPPAAADDGAPVAPAPALTAGEVDAALERVLARPEFAWRLPPAPLDAAVERGALASLVDSIVKWTSRMVRALGRLIEEVFDALSGDDGPVVTDRSGSASLEGLVGLLRTLLPVLGLALLGAVAWFGWRWWAGMRAAPAPTAPPITTPVLEREDVTADVLPEDGWMRLAAELRARGEARGALRALFLGSLAALAARGALVLARHKSNRDYERELARRGGLAQAGIPEVFAENRRAFERAWYGRHAVGTAEVERFEANVRRIRGGDA